MPYTLPPLPFAFNALEPHIDSATMELHHGKHHRSYVEKLNKALESSSWKDTPIEKLLPGLDQLPEEIRTEVRNNGGGHWNHTFFWSLLTPGGSHEPSEPLTEVLLGAFDSVRTMVAEFEAAGMKRFGSGWVWLVHNSDGEFEIVSTPNQDSPLMIDLHPLFGCDLWEHAYYLKYHQDRSAYLKAFWKVLNWDTVEFNLKNTPFETPAAF